MFLFVQLLEKYEQKPDNFWIVMGSVGYALSAYSVQYYLLPWLDIAVMFPLLIYALLL